jgi:hypothetical protein
MLDDASAGLQMMMLIIRAYKALRATVLVDMLISFDFSNNDVTRSLVT